MSLRVVLISFPSMSNVTDDLSSALMGEKNPRAAGKIVVACCSFPTVVWNVFIGTDFLRSIVWVSLMYFLAFWEVA